MSQGSANSPTANVGNNSPDDPTAAYIETIEKLTDRPALLGFWQKIRSGDTPDFKSGKALEYFVLQAFKLEGADVTWPYSVSLGELDDDESEKDGEQIDGAIFVDGIHSIIEAKDWAITTRSKGKVGFDPIAKLRSQLLRRPGLTIGMIFSTNGFTPPAKALTKFIAPQTILLWDGNDIEEALKDANLGMRGGLKKKLRWAVERGVPDLPLVKGV